IRELVARTGTMRARSVSRVHGWRTKNSPTSGHCDKLTYVQAGRAVPRERRPCRMGACTVRKLPKGASSWSGSIASNDIAKLREYLGETIFVRAEVDEAASMR